MAKVFNWREYSETQKARIAQRQRDLQDFVDAIQVLDMLHDCAKIDDVFAEHFEWVDYRDGDRFCRTLVNRSTSRN
jgi:hypothetical protein